MEVFHHQYQLHIQCDFRISFEVCGITWILEFPLGIHHHNRYNAYCLADDIMEPYRPYVDEIVFDLYANGEQELNKDVKAELLKLLYVLRIENTIIFYCLTPLQP